MRNENLSKAFSCLFAVPNQTYAHSIPRRISYVLGTNIWRTLSLMNEWKGNNFNVKNIWTNSTNSFFPTLAMLEKSKHVLFDSPKVYTKLALRDGHQGNVFKRESWSLPYVLDKSTRTRIPLHSWLIFFSTHSNNTPAISSTPAFQTA